MSVHAEHPTARPPAPAPPALAPAPAPSDLLAPSTPDPDDEPFYVFKRIAVLGARGVGKSALSIRVAQNRFEPNYMLTFQDMYQWRPVVNSVQYDVSILDTDGQDENSEFGMRYTTGVDAYVLVFSVRDESSYEVIKQVNEKLLVTLNVTERVGTSEVPRVLVGNQIDIAHQRQVPSQEAAKFASNEGIPYLETSAFTSQNVNEAFDSVLCMIQQNLRNSHVIPTHTEEDEEEEDIKTPDLPPPETNPNPGCLIQ
ncbi:Rheb1 [Chondrus crispus]|uniref:Rheb1 n=1 Tax=Chondrus crispus TaxID=2769 RepID=R7QRP1_CHOCR|nr:Rheb1 [Chondrus crispus]CDF40166.1 Rheb1 [Chondrus crispus]|eukprot:XP_005710460.1 Rheb1 [Chondrus crispus]